MVNTKIYFFWVALMVSALCSAQPAANGQNIPLMRQLFHANIDAAQKKILASDGVDDSLFAPGQNTELNKLLTYTATEKIDLLQLSVESDSLLDNNSKIKFLRGLDEALRAFYNGFEMREIKASVLPKLVEAFEQAMPLEASRQSIESVIASNNYEVDNILLHTVSFSSNSGIESCMQQLLLKYCNKYPDKALSKLNDNPDLPFADSLITVIARRDPGSLYTYAQASNELAHKIQNNPDTLVKIITRMAKLQSGRQLFPFLDNIYHGNISFEQIDSAMQDSVKYYKLLVKTEIDYADRVRRKDTPMGMQSLTLKLQKNAIDPFVNTINGLHDINDENIRFRIIEPFGPQDLYYMAVLTEEEIYTSSYVKGIYPRVWKGPKPPRADSLLMSVKFDRFRKWIKMAANYNTLDNFLKRMDKGNAEVLMKAFANGLERNFGPDSLEDAVDVANSYASITDKGLQKLILNQVQYNLQQAQQKHNTKAINIYGILNTLFLSMDSANHIDITKTLGIPPVYFMPNKDLKNDSGKIIVQQFFYGDKDGKGVFNSFLSNFSNANWKKTDAEKWVKISSAKGTPLEIYANKPLDETKNLDAEAQAALHDYMIDNDITPTVVIHRGHSYWLPYTIEQLEPSARVVLLGSCGAYQSLNKILKICPTAQIVASKQTGSGSVNAPMIYAIMDQLRQGKDLNWPAMWSYLSKIINDHSLFDDYVPPQKNLGALFIMAYKQLQEKEEQEN